MRVFGDADEAARQVAFELVFHREVGGVRPAVAERHAETLRAADGHVRAEFARRLEDAQRERVGGDDGEGVWRRGLFP